MELKMQEDPYSPLGGRMDVTGKLMIPPPIEIEEWIQYLKTAAKVLDTVSKHYKPSDIDALIAALLSLTQRPGHKYFGKHNSQAFDMLPLKEVLEEIRNDPGCNAVYNATI